MSKVRIWYWPDSKVSISHPDLRPRKKPENMTMNEWIDKQLNDVSKKAPQYQGLQYDDVDSSTLPIRNEDRNRWRGSKGQGIRIDGTVVLRQDLLQQIDDELVKAEPSVVEIERLRRKVEKGKHD